MKSRKPESSRSGAAAAGSKVAPPCFKETPEGCRLQVKLIPRAARDEVGELRGEYLVIRVTAPPVDEAANQALRMLLADRLGCAASRIQVERGHHSRQKTLLIAGLDAATVAARLLPGAQTGAA
jgi:uncharacterized protein YggU (UPF0235/DUF167 family)